MKIGEILERVEGGVAFEFFPPKTDEGKDRLLEVVRELRACDPAYVSVTYGAGGSSRERTRDLLLRIGRETDLTVMSHLTGIGATREETDRLLRDYEDNGIENILALRGDPPKEASHFETSDGPFPHAKDLVRFIRGYGSFSVGVAVYPEGHQEAPSPDADLEFTKQKVDAGADFAITQMFFDNAYFYRFMERARRKGVTIPILPGIMPITDFARTKGFASICGATIPAGIERRMGRVLDRPGEMRHLGIELAVEQCADLLRNGFRFLHFYTLNRSDAVREILDELGGDLMAPRKAAAASG